MPIPAQAVEVALPPRAGRAGPASLRTLGARPLHVAPAALIRRSVQLLEAAELVKQIETTFGVDASAPAGGVMMAAGPAGPAAEAEEAQSEFNLIILDCAADKRIAAIKVVRSLTTLGLKEAKDAVTALPFVILEAKSKADVDKAKAELEAAGCKCAIK